MVGDTPRPRRRLNDVRLGDGPRPDAVVDLVERPQGGLERYDEAEASLRDALAIATGEIMECALGAIVDLYESWDTAEPDADYADQAAEWRAKLDKLAETQPAE